MERKKINPDILNHLEEKMGNILTIIDTCENILGAKTKPSPTQSG